MVLSKGACDAITTYSMNVTGEILFQVVTETGGTLPVKDDEEVGIGKIIGSQWIQCRECLFAMVREEWRGGGRLV